ncbi:MAG TPA: heme-binding protein [Pseudolabrys sp.]|jgi:uncharacterized protein GlcG (DUF336 family)|nr:heme-binding protein [Pseudolabrys sp.]
MSSIVKIAAGLAAALALSLPAHGQGLITEKNVSLAMAQSIATGALEKCQSMGYKVSVVVLDRAGVQIVMLRGDGAGLHTAEGADRKAYTARTYGAPSDNFAKRVASDPGYAQAVHYSRVLALGGGLPIKAGNEVVGAVGVSGSPGKDDVCSQAGIDKVADQLK